MSRKQIQKRKLQLRQSITPPPIDEIEIREATKKKLTELLDSPNASEVALKIEDALNSKFKASSPAYKAQFRRIFISLKLFREDLLNGDLDPHKFALKSAEELKSNDLREKDLKLKNEEMRMSIGTQLLPENVNKMKDGRDREKWGVSRSAAALD